ncbi:PH domain-containing protein [Vulcaniibacterium tengchongense]|uniref:YdbS-like PH domain-containing protein n=1 Tax=Vulcaniibacterium tengchongense TaxID=1273429 RepID=A0A3N4VA15_9GAMM|nr:PH domain-containing protein [Vulcaniibacterium tengchongense]RPE79822.1 hypothetical protein EDC50_1650 [Vulcaniibacterium tengchongense]
MSEAGAPPAAAAEAPWQPLPARARPLFALERALALAVPGGIAGGLLALAGGWTRPLVLGAGAALLALAVGYAIGMRQFRHVAWRLDEEGLAIRRGRLWQRETRVPATRVQHLDLKRGPWQRRRALATLTVHTAGTRHSAVTVPHLDAADAERLRDRLGRQGDGDDADEQA